MSQNVLTFKNQSGLLSPWAYGDSSVKGGRGVDLPEILRIIFFLLALPSFAQNLGGQLPPPLPRTPMAVPFNMSAACFQRMSFLCVKGHKCKTNGNARDSGQKVTLASNIVYHTLSVIIITVLIIFILQ